MDYRPVNIRLTPGTDDKLAEYLARFDEKNGGRAGGAKRLMLRALGLTEPPVVLQVDEETLKRIVQEVTKSE